MGFVESWSYSFYYTCNVLLAEEEKKEKFQVFSHSHQRGLIEFLTTPGACGTYVKFFCNLVGTILNELDLFARKKI